MPRDLADVLHYFLPELDGADATGTAPAAADPEAPAPRAAGGAPFPILGLPSGDRDVVRAALAWNLAVEIARLGGTSIILAPESDRGSPLWPSEGIGPLGCEVVYGRANDLTTLHTLAADLAAARAEKAPRDGIVFTRIPPAWLVGRPGIVNPIPWLLLLTSARHRDLDEAFDLIRALLRARADAEIGVTIHGAVSIADAQKGFDSLARRVESELDALLTSYGLLVDDLHVYRAIAAQRPIGLAHPQAPATRALMDVARLLYEDARSQAVG